MKTVKTKPDEYHTIAINSVKLYCGRANNDVISIYRCSVKCYTAFF